jgi:hypothetical protein
MLFLPDFFADGKWLRHRLECALLGGRLFQPIPAG